MQEHFTPLQETVTPLVMLKDLLTGTWKGPDVFITSGKIQKTSIWIPDRLIQHFHQKTSVEIPEKKIK